MYILLHKNTKSCILQGKVHTVSSLQESPFQLTEPPSWGHNPMYLPLCWHGGLATSSTLLAAIFRFPHHRTATLILEICILLEDSISRQIPIEMFNRQIFFYNETKL